MKPEEITKWARDKVKELKVSIPDFPEDHTAIGNVELQQYMSRFSGAYAWSSRRVGLTEIDYTAASEVLTNELNIKGLKYREGLGRVSVDVVNAAVLEGDEELRDLNLQVMKLKALLTLLETSSRICDKLWQALSREQARREMESRLI